MIFIDSCNHFVAFLFLLSLLSNLWSVSPSRGLFFYAEYFHPKKRKFRENPKKKSGKIREILGKFEEI